MIIIDRFEEDLAIVEKDEKLLQIKKSLLPDNVKEGDVLIMRGENYHIDEKATARRRAEALAKLKRIGL